MDVLGRLLRWLTPSTQRPLLDMIDAWLRTPSQDVLVLEHRFSRCELRRREATVSVFIPASTLLLHGASESLTAPADPYAFDTDSGCYRRDYACASSSTPNMVRILAQELQRVVDRYFQRPEGVSPVLTRETEGWADPTTLKTPGSFNISMRALAKTRSLDDRRLVYQAFLNSKLLVPLRFSDDAPGALRVLPAEQAESGAAVWAVFTNWEEAHRWRRSTGDAPKPWSIFSGLQLVALALRETPSSLLINPGGNVGGEFFAHEVEQLARVLHLSPPAETSSPPRGS